MENNFNEETSKEKIIYTIMRVLRIAFWIFLAYYIYLSVKAGEYVSKPLPIALMIVPIGIYNILAIRKRFQIQNGNNKKFNKIFLRSVLLAFLIIAIVVVVSVLHALSKY